MIDEKLIDSWKIHFENYMTNKRGWRGGYLKSAGRYVNSYLQYAWEMYFAGRAIERKTTLTNNQK